MVQQAGESRRAVPGRDAGLTVGLLLIGVVHVTYEVAHLHDLPDTLDQQSRALGIGAGYTMTQTAAVAGWIAGGALLLALVLAIGFAVPRLRTGRTAWWIPVVAAVVGWVVVGAIIGGAWFADPVVAAQIVGTGSSSPAPS